MRRQLAAMLRCLALLLDPASGGVQFATQGNTVPSGGPGRGSYLWYGPDDPSSTGLWSDPLMWSPKDGSGPQPCALVTLGSSLEVMKSATDESTVDKAEEARDEGPKPQA